jgi:hypothetical protein
MRVLVLVAAAIGVFALALFAFGHFLGAWSSPAGAGTARNANTTAADRETTVPNADEQADRNTTRKRGSASKQVRPAVARRVDRLCRSARKDALSLINMAPPPTSTKRLEWLFARIRHLNRDYNDAILGALGRKRADGRVRTLSRLFRRDEILFDQLVRAIPEIDSAAGRSLVETRLQRLRLLATRQTVILEELGTQACDTALMPTS